MALLNSFTKGYKFCINNIVVKRFRQCVLSAYASGDVRSCELHIDKLTPCKNDVGKFDHTRLQAPAILNNSVGLIVYQRKNQTAGLTLNNVILTNHENYLS